jgi:hypothetical protein
MQHAARRARPRVAGALACMLLAAALALAGCDQTSATTTPYVTPPPAPSWTPTATVLVPSIADWATYTDSAFHFKAVIPPGWRLGTYLDTRSDVGGDCEYVVVYFPPGDTHQAYPLVEMEMHEYMEIGATLKCHPWSPADNHHVTPAGPVTISGVPATLYSNDNNDEVSRITFAQFGGHQFTFILLGSSRSEVTGQYTPIPADIPLYLGMLSGFQYLGA